MANMELNFVLATIKDIPELVEINLREYSSDLIALDPFDRFPITQWWGSVDLLTWHYSLLKKADGGILIAKDKSGKIVAELEYIKNKQFIHIFWLYVLPEHRRLGVARSLLKTFLESIDRKVLVEAEDDRSENLYKSFGKQEKMLRNFEIIFEEGVIPPNSSLVYSESSDLSILEGKYRLIGQYNLPEFDLLQLHESIGSIAESIIWGTTLPPKILHFSNGYWVLVTQYIRVYSDIQHNFSGLREVLLSSIYHAYLLDFVGVHFQIYDDSKLVKILEDIGINEVDESNDPIFNLSIQ